MFHSARFSIIVPTYNRKPQVVDLLRSLAHLDYAPGEVEVILVDDGGRESIPVNPQELVSPFPLQVIRQKHAGPAAARNQGASIARGEYLVFLDDDCRPEPDWLHRFETRMAVHGESCIGARAVNALPRNPFSAANHVLLGYFSCFNNPDPLHAHFLASNAFAVRAEAFRRVGGFNTAFRSAGGEDREFCARWMSSGFDLVYAPEVTVTHDHWMSLSSFLRKHYEYGRGACLYRQLAPNANGKARPGFFLGLLKAPFEGAPRWHAMLLSALLACSQTATVAGYLRQRFLAAVRK
jgi:GT2 family glycosyltransferase